MKLGNIFGMNANFSNILVQGRSAQDLAVSAIIQKAHIEVDAKGSIAAAETTGFFLLNVQY